MNAGPCENAAAWDAYVEAHPQASNYHRWLWKQVIEETYGHRTFYLAAQEQGEIRGVLPLVEMKSWLWGRFLVSMPFCSYGGVLASDTPARESLLRKAEEIARESRADYIELRQGDILGNRWQSSTGKVCMKVALPASPEALFGKLSSRLRNKIRGAEKQGLQAVWGKEELLDEFYSVFSRNMRNLGTPVYPRRWFENFLRSAESTTQILLVRDGSEPVAATWVTTFREEAELPWIASTPEARGKYSTSLLYWKALEWATEKGFRRMDLGRCTPGSGTYRFKTQWLCEEIPLSWNYWLKEGESLPHLRPDNPRLRLAVETWKRLPLGLANWLGPRIVRAIP
ncbi:MAG: FemAB family XrtA/PEP-CTERM system-associated protein [Candidatus Acidiferrales bacterium]